MFNAGLGLFGAYAALLVIDELRFHRRRDPGRPERAAHLVDTFLLTAMMGLVVAFEYGEAIRMVFGAIAVLTIANRVRSERAFGAARTPGEQAVHAGIFMLHPLMLAGAMVCWDFIDGAGFFLGAVLPFSAKNLRPLCTGYLAFLGAMAAYQAYFWNATRRRQSTVPTVTAASANVVAVAAPAPAEVTPAHVVPAKKAS